MRSPRHSTNPATLSPENLFSPDFFALLRERDEVLTASEAEYAGPWKCEPVAGQPGAVAVLRDWESVDHQDVPEAVVWHDETALLLTAILPALDREPLFHLSEVEAPEGYPLSAVYGEQGVQVAGWLRRFKPEVVQELHLLECVLRSPAALAALLEAAGCTAVEQAGQIVARRLAQ
jgi:hypothetical protein